MRDNVTPLPPIKIDLSGSDLDRHIRLEQLLHTVREVAERLSIEGQLAAPVLSEEGRLRAKMGDCSRDLFKALRALATLNNESKPVARTGSENPHGN